MTQADLDAAVQAHRLWLASEEGGVRANLAGADIARADLTRAYLRGADLEGADLRGADLIDADLTDADLTDADFEGADLRGADLRGAVLPPTMRHGNVGGYRWTAWVDGDHVTLAYGCEQQPLEWWLEQGPELSVRHGHPAEHWDEGPMVAIAAAESLAAESLAAAQS